VHIFSIFHLKGPKAIELQESGWLKASMQWEGGLKLKIC